MARSVATHIITMNRVKNSSAEPRSFSATITATANAHASVIGSRKPQLGDAQRADAPGAGRDQLAVVGQVAGEEQRQRDLGELARLEVDRADAHPDARAADAGADAGHERQHQQTGADEQERPLVAGEVGRALHDQQREHEGDDGDERPRGLQRRRGAR